MELNNARVFLTGASGLGQARVQCFSGIGGIGGTGSVAAPAAHQACSTRP
jgi:hypothetical protein